jgi:multiple sugar transport system ATP-binding protein
MASITLKNISKVYEGGVTAVSDFNMEIADHEFVVLVGPSGCGKSTTLRMIAGLEEITQGELYIGDRLVNDVAPKDRDIAMVFQNYALYPHMTVYKNMAFGLQNRKVPKKIIDERVHEAAKILDIENLLDRKPKAMSGGQRQRVALGRALVRDPAVFLLDEPLSNLDAKLRTSMRTEIIKLHKRLGTTFVYVTHDQVEAMTMGDRIVVMKDGFVQQIDTPQNLYDHPCNMFVAGFIGTPQMNFVDVAVALKDGEITLMLGEIAIPYQGAADLTGHIGRTVVMGVRPDNVHLSDTGLSTQVDVVEQMGGETYLYMDCFGTRLIVKIAGQTTVKMDEQVCLTFEADRIHLFDKETQRTLEALPEAEQQALSAANAPTEETDAELEPAELSSISATVAEIKQEAETRMQE